ncbi:hypothetical protein T484DRAFT_1967847 [Baffinella frigidus]|nr:hypothetical protein T484DRAFT_1967847 [Cryptophyta sp. CCMP2293]
MWWLWEQEEVMRKKEFLPQLLRPARVQEEDWATQDLRNRLHALQFDPRSCGRAAIGHFPNHGAAATLNYLVIQLKRGLRDMRPVVLQGPWIYAGCEAGDLSCVFLPTSVCDTSNITLGPDGAPEAPVYPGRVEEQDPGYVPLIYATEGKSLLWFTSILTGSIFRPKPAYQARVAHEIEKLGLSVEPFIGMQVRRGDACGQTRVCYNLEDYQEAAVQLAGKYGISLVYLATDDPEAVGLLTEGLGAHGIRVVAQTTGRDFQASNTEACAALANQGIRTLNVDHVGCEWIEDKLKRASTSDKTEQAMGVVVDISILALSDAFVGTFTSALSRVAFQLSYSQKGFVKPYVSLDIPWCWAGFHQIHVPWGTYGC